MGWAVCVWLWCISGMLCRPRAVSPLSPWRRAVSGGAVSLRLKAPDLEEAGASLVGGIVQTEWAAQEPRAPGRSFRTLSTSWSCQGWRTWERKKATSC